ncbi:MAG: type I 3-dehydroquinate dehydratase [bacterium]|nr:type I 3-dehydroquinate dehydratase [bacterium]
MTRLLTSVSAQTSAELHDCIYRAFSVGAECVELRLDHLTEDVTPETLAGMLAELAPGTWVVTLRSAKEGGGAGASDGERLTWLHATGGGLGGWLDFEHRALSDQACAAAWEELRAAGLDRWILSYHDFSGRPTEVGSIAREIASAGDEVVSKVAWRGEGASDNLLAFELMRALGDRVIAVVMGEVGMASRVLAKKFGAAATYCALSEGGETAPGQPTLEEMLHRYRWGDLTAATKWYGVLGAPVSHSLSPALFNRIFDRAGIDAVYLPMLVGGGEAELVEFLGQCAQRPWLDVGGFSVTIPHKSAARRFVGSRIEPLAARIGAVNTLVMGDGHLHGYNTDYAGALDALCVGLGCERVDLRGLPVDVLGAGGVARAVVAGLNDCGCAVTVYRREADAAAAAELVDELGGQVALWEDLPRRSGRAVVNCTPLGMSPQVEDSPLPCDGLTDKPLVFDMVYNPVETRLLRDARAAGCPTVDGVDMFVRQAAAQYRLWFGDPPDVASMRSVVLEALGG